MSPPRLSRSKSGVYYVVWSEGRRSKRVSTRTRNVGEATAFLGEWIRLPRGAGPVEDLTCAEAWQAYKAGHIERVHARQPVKPEALLRAWSRLAPFFADLPVRSVNQRHVDVFVAARRRDGLRDSTIWYELRILLAIWNHAASRKVKLIPSTDIPAVDLPAAPEPRERWLSETEIARLLDAARARAGARLSPVEIFLWLALETAARRQAILDLTWDRVDFDADTPVIHYALPGRRQTRKRRASVPISDALMPILRRAQRESASPHVVGTLKSPNVAIAAVARAAGVAGVTPHVMRHTAASHMARNGVPLWLIAKILGNTAAVVEKSYAKHAPEHLLSAVNARATMSAARSLSIENGGQ